MRNSSPPCVSTPRQQSFRQSMQRGLLALAIALQCAPILADEADAVAKSNVSSAPKEEISWMSGGIGDDARDAMRKAAIAYNVHLVFSDRHGSYLASIPFKVTRRDGAVVCSDVSEGPLLFLKLAPGSYRISAEIDGVWQSKRIQIQAGAAWHSTKLSFISRGD